MPPGMRRDLTIGIESELDDRGFKSATTSASVFERELAKLERRQQQVDKAAQRVGRGLVLFGGAVAAGLALATKAAIDWETAWAGVTKTVEGSPEQLAALEEELRGLAKTLPATHAEIAGVAEAAGQLGIQRENIAEFTKTMIDLGISTNLSAQEAATALARLSNIMGVSADEVDRLGATLVDLGNKGASTEAEIVNMALGIAGAGRTIGISADQVLAWANALSSVGVEAEAGGSAISRVFITVDQAASQGGDALADFARVAGMSAEEFRQAYERDASGAIAAFVTGLGRMRGAGEDVFGVLEDLGLNEIRVRRALLSMANAGDMLTTSLDDGSTAWRENTALLEEANKRYATTASKIRVAQNQVNDFAIDIGQTFLPLVGAASDILGGLVGIIDSLPGPLKQAAAILAAVTAVFALVGVAAMLATVQVARFKEAQASLALVGTGLSTRLAGVAGFLTGPWGIAIAGATVLLGMFVSQHQKAGQQSRELAATLDKTTAALTGQTREMIANSLAQEGLLDTARELGVSFDLVQRAALGEKGALEELNAALGLSADKLEAANLGQSGLGQGLDENTVKALAFSNKIREQAGALTEAQRKTRDAAAANRDHASASAEAGEAAAKTDPAVRGMATALGMTETEAEDATDALRDFEAQINALFDAAFGYEEAQDALTNSIKAFTKRVKDAKEAGDDNATSLRGNSEAALGNRDAMRDMVEAAGDVVAEYARTHDSTEDVAGKTRQLKTRLYEAARQMGLSKEEARRYIEKLDDIPTAHSTSFTTPGLSDARSRAAELARVLRNMPRNVFIRTQFIGGGEIAAEGGQVGVGRLPRFGSGGQFRGRGGPKDDANLVALSNREFVHPVEAVDHYGVRFMEAVRTRQYRVPAGAAAGGGGQAASGPDAAALSRLVTREVRAELHGMSVVLDGRKVGEIEARQADIYDRGG